MSAPAKHLVYQLWAGDRCIYVGMSKDLAKRLYQHKNTKPWWDDVTNVTSAPYPTSREAHQAERELIVAIRPEHNRAWNPDHDPKVLEHIAFRKFVESVTEEGAA